MSSSHSSTMANTMWLKLAMIDVYNYSGTHEDDEKIAKTRDVTLNHRNTFHNAKWPPKTCSL